MSEQYYIVRCAEAGVFFGKISSREGTEVELSDARRIWYWDGAFTLSALATEGTKKASECKFSCNVKNMLAFGVCELIPCTDKAVESIKSVRTWLA